MNLVKRTGTVFMTERMISAQIGEDDRDEYSLRYNREERISDMTVTLSPQTEMLLQEHAGLLGQEAKELADALLLDALEAARQEYEETCQAIAEGLADMYAGRTVSFEEVRARREAQRAKP